MSEPQLRTERLILRRWQQSDREPFAAINADPQVLRYVGRGSPMTRAQSDALIDHIEAQFVERGFGLWAAVDQRDETLLGFIGLLVPTFLPEILPAVEIGWRLGRWAWGRGYATEGATQVVSFAFEELSLDRIVSIYHPDNQASRRVMDKLGMTFDRDTVVPANGVPARVMALSRDEWFKARS